VVKKKLVSISSDPSTQLLADKVKQLRKKEHWTLEQLATASGVSRSMLSQIERGQANPTLAVTCRIAQAFQISLAELVDQPWAEQSIDVVHGDDPANVFRDDGTCRVRTLSPLNLEKNVEFYEVILSAASELSSAAHVEGCRELFTVSKGAALIESGNTRCKLKKGDSAHYRADVEHSIKNTGASQLHGYLVVTYD
jgi:transcriptional regulator with XRE-family HTH domain